MIAGLEYEEPEPAAVFTASSSSTAASNNYYHAGSLHRRYNATAGGPDNGHHHNSNASSSQDDNKYTKYSKQTRLLKKVDFFPKTDIDYEIRTERGAQLTFIGYLLMLILILAEFITWTSSNSEAIEHIVVDTSIGKRMRVNLNITFMGLHCDDLHLDVIDVAGDSQMDISDNMFKRRLSLQGGRPIGTRANTNNDAVQKVEANIKAAEDKKVQDLLKAALPKDYCGPCYGAAESEGDCCNTCDDVLTRYKNKRWNENAVQPLAEQCIREGRGKVEPKRMSKGEGCNLHGHFTVNRVAGNFHIAMGEGVDRDGRHIHQFLPEDRINFNASHVIHELSFLDEEYGDIVGVHANGKKKRKKKGIDGERSMNGVTKIVTEDTGTTGLFQYFIKVVPTVYKGDILDDLGLELKNSKAEKVLETNRYFYTERFRPLLGEVHEEAILSGDSDRGMAGAHIGGKTGGTLHEKAEHHATANAVLPGVFFVYEIYPFAVEITKNRVPLAHLLIRIMATIGGVMTIMKWIDGALYSREKKKLLK
ncbi:hypothetical protein ACHAXM_006184 [Skeletonema potamos]